VDVIGHEAIGVNLQTIFAGNGFPEFQIILVAFRLDETGFPIIATLHDMVGKSRYVTPWPPWHTTLLV
jgi:hypothetical protein